MKAAPADVVLNPRRRCHRCDDDCEVNRLVCPQCVEVIERSLAVRGTAAS